MPCFFKRSTLASDAATAPSILFFIEARASMNLNTVEPEPTPTTASCTTCLSASRVTSSLGSFCVFASSEWPVGRRAPRAQSLFLRRQGDTDALVEIAAHADRLAEGRMRMDGLADVGCVRAHHH